MACRESLCGIVPADHPTGQQAFWHPSLLDSITRGVFCNIPGKHAYIPGKHPNPGIPWNLMTTIQFR